MTTPDGPFYLFASTAEDPECSPATVFYRAPSEALSASLLRLFVREYSESRPPIGFAQVAAGDFPLEDQILLDEALDQLEIYDDPDPGVYDPSPSQHTLYRAQMARRALKWEDMLHARTAAPPTSEATSGAHSQDEHVGGASGYPAMPAEQRRSSGLSVLLLLAQAYYTLAESAISMASWVTALDLPLNESYFWTVNNLHALLANHPDLRGFPTSFAPVFSDLYPTTIRDVDWEDVAPEVEAFLAAVQRYVQTQRPMPLDEGTPGWVFVELFRGGAVTAIERGNAYSRRMRAYCDKALGTPGHPAPAGNRADPNSAAAEPSGPARPIAGGIFISYSHKDRKFMKELMAHLRPLERLGRVTLWSDQQIGPGAEWRQEIRDALAASKVAVLLVTKDFLASDFIHDHELAPILQQSIQRGLAIRWVLVRECNWRKSSLERYQAAFPTVKPLAEMKAERDTAWVQICESIESAGTTP